MNWVGCSSLTACSPAIGCQYRRRRLPPSVPALPGPAAGFFLSQEHVSSPARIIRPFPRFIASASPHDLPTPPRGD